MEVGEALEKLRAAGAFRRGGTLAVRLRDDGTWMFFLERGGNVVWESGGTAAEAAKRLAALAAGERHGRLVHAPAAPWNDEEEPDG